MVLPSRVGCPSAYGFFPARTALSNRICFNCSSDTIPALHCTITVKSDSNVRHSEGMNSRLVYLHAGEYMQTMHLLTHAILMMA